jgi:hypothetical protein
MLDRIESAYLAVMRVVVLVAATLALLACVVGASFAAPVLLRQLGFAAEHRVEPPSLGSFVAEQKIGPDDAASADGAAGPQATIVPGKIAKASGMVADYLHERSHEEIDRVALQQALTEKRAAIDPDYQAAYEDSLLALANELKASTGRPLELQRVLQLLDWHAARFEAAVAAKKDEGLAQAAKASAGMSLAAGGLVAFLLILFFFLFVKIERNLRLVRTREVAAP